MSYTKAVEKFVPELESRDVGTEVDAIEETVPLLEATDSGLTLDELNGRMSTLEVALEEIKSKMRDSNQGRQTVAVSAAYQDKFEVYNYAGGRAESALDKAMDSLSIEQRILIRSALSM